MHLNLNKLSSADGERRLGSALASALAVVLDANFPPAALSEVGDVLSKNNRSSRDGYDLETICLEVLWEPTSVAKAARAFSTSLAAEITLTTPNLAELVAMAHSCGNRGSSSGATNYAPAEDACAEFAAKESPAIEAAVAAAAASGNIKELSSLLAPLLAPVVRYNMSSGHVRSRGIRVLLTLGAHGVVAAEQAEVDVCSGGASCAAAGVRAVWVRAVPLTDNGSAPHEVNVTGAGDTLTGAALWFLLHENQSRIAANQPGGTFADAASFGAAAASSAVMELSAAVPKSLSRAGIVPYLIKRAEATPKSHLP